MAAQELLRRAFACICVQATTTNMMGTVRYGRPRPAHLCIPMLKVSEPLALPDAAPLAPHDRSLRFLNQESRRRSRCRRRCSAVEGDDQPRRRIIRAGLRVAEGCLEPWRRRCCRRYCAAGVNDSIARLGVGGGLWIAAGSWKPRRGL